MIGAAGTESSIRGGPHLDQDAKDELTASILQHVSELNRVKNATAEIPVGRGATKPAKLDIVETSLDKTSALLDRLQSTADGAIKLGGKAIAFSSTVGPLIAKVVPLVASARHLLGIP
jgi:hypothetical protein